MRTQFEPRAAPAHSQARGAGEPDSAGAKVAAALGLDDGPQLLGCAIEDPIDDPVVVDAGLLEGTQFEAGAIETAADLRLAVGAAGAQPGFELLERRSTTKIPTASRG